MNTLQRAAMAGMLLEILQIVSVIKGDFLSWTNIAQGRDPDSPFLANRFAIGRAAMIQKTRRIPFHIPVQIKLIIQPEDEPIHGFAPPRRFHFGNSFAYIFNDPAASRKG